MREHQWAPTAGLVALAWVLAAGAVGWLVVLLLGDADPAGRLIAGVAALGLAYAALVGTIARPRLALHRHGLEVRSLTRRRSVDWPAVQRVRVLRTRRFGRETSLLELDLLVGGEERLVVLGRLDLGADPEDVAEVLRPYLPNRS
ncbi:PH domain-containing protein [Pseudonocardia kujensis]|uniref:PH domain-containing protein n=1 Tax=Pseudonocardia kujensis TaxID=1128675 RepID=UPI001E644DBA|nr:PH domain-containing protein [Pseudonocardia kujensis]MCE0761861.1 PH domain-containing protein [Pseudonocardia kujensis]